VLELKKLFVLVGFALMVLLLAAFAWHSSARAPKPIQVEASEISDPAPCLKGKGKYDPHPALVAPVFISKPNPKYTADSFANRIQGVITLYVLVHKNGEVDVEGIEGRLGYGLDAEAIRVGKAARFKPATSHGHPVEWHHVLYVNFLLPQEVAAR
jgi:TonB family protein